MDVRNEVWELLLARSPLAMASGGAALADDLLLGAGGLGLDSIAMVELLLDCERRFGVPALDLLDGAPLTIGRLLVHLGAAGSS